jgi:hypothetical protein
LQVELFVDSGNEDDSAPQISEEEFAAFVARLGPFETALTKLARNFVSRGDDGKLSVLPWLHGGKLSRHKASMLIDKEGQFLVRSGNSPPSFVLMCLRTRGELQDLASEVLLNHKDGFQHGDRTRLLPACSMSLPSCSLCVARRVRLHFGRHYCADSL